MEKEEQSTSQRKGSMSVSSRRFMIISLIASVVMALLSTSSIGTLLTDQAANVRINGTLVQSANLTVSIYNTTSGGTPIYTELFQDAVSGGSWDITLGETAPLTLEYGKTYYMDQLINTVNLDYKNNTGGTVDRKAFISTMGLISSEDINPATTLNIAGLNIAGNLNVTGSIISPVLASMPNLSLSQIADNIGNFSAWSNSTFITAANFTNWVNASGLIINWSGIGDNLAWQTLGNWSSDKLSYYTISQVSTIGNWSADKTSYSTTSEANNLYAPIAEPIALTLGNWSADKSSYATNTALTNNYSALDSKYNTIGNWSNDKIGKLLWDDSDGNATFTTGNVGIGTANPFSLLNIKGENARLRISSNISNAGDVGIDFQHAISDVQKTAIIARAAGIYGRSDIHFVLNGDTDSDNYVIENDTKMIIKSTGNVGIGTTSPSALLHLYADQNPAPEVRLTRYLEGDDSVRLRFQKARGNVSSPVTVQDGGDLGAIVFQGYDGDEFTNAAYLMASVDGTPGDDDMPGRLEFYTVLDNSTSAGLRMVIKNDGNVGIGTTDPQRPLHLLSGPEVGGSSSHAGTILLLEKNETNVLSFKSSNSTGQYINFGDTEDTNVGQIGYSHITDSLWFVTNALTHMFIDSSGNVGIGTTSPEAPLHINNSGSHGLEIFRDGGSELALRAHTTQAFIGTTNENPLRLMTNSTERLSIDSSGNVGIGITVPTYLLHIKGLSSDEGIKLENNAGSEATIRVGNYGAANNSKLVFSTEDDGVMTSKMTLTDDGKLGIGTTSPSSKLTVQSGTLGGSSFFGSIPSLAVIGDNISSRTDSTVQQILYLHQPNTDSLSKGSAFGIGLSYWEDAGNNYPRTRVDFQTTGRTTDSVQASNTVMSLRDDGYVGIGTNSPQEKLDLDDSTDKVGIQFGLESYGSKIIGYSGTNSSWNDLEIRTRNGVGSGLYLKTDGNIGIGTTNPTQILDITSNIDNSALNLFNDSQGIRIANHNQALGSYSSLKLEVRGDHDGAYIRGIHRGNNNIDVGIGKYYSGGANSVELMTILNSGNVGIGTTSPARLLHLYTSSDTSALRISQSGVGSFDIGVRTGDVLSIGPNDDIQSLNIDSSSNVGIGTTSPLGKLSVGAGNIVLQNIGTSVQRGLKFYEDAAHTMSIQYDGRGSGDDNKIHIYGNAGTLDSDEIVTFTRGGNVGIGTTSPSHELTIWSESSPTIVMESPNIYGGSLKGVRGNSTKFPSTGTNLLILYGGGYINSTNKNEGATSISFQGDGAWNSSQSPSKILFSTTPENSLSSSTKMTIDSTGNVGIGTTSPDNKLHVYDTGSSTRPYIMSETTNTESYAGYKLKTPVGDANIYMAGAGDPKLRFNVNSGDKMVIDGSTGNVGIGTTNPSSALHIKTGTSGQPTHNTEDDVVFESETHLYLNFDTQTDKQVGILFNDDVRNKGSVLYHHGGDYMRFTVNGNERVRIDSGGNVGVGDTTPDANLDVDGIIGGAIEGGYVGDWNIPSNNTGHNFTFPRLPPGMKGSMTVAVEQNDLEAHIDLIVNGVNYGAFNAGNSIREWREYNITGADLNSDAENIIGIWHDGGDADWGHVYRVMLYYNPY